ncbi:MAG: HNH endonuclease [Campylobacterales bacterium]|nr:HNH endonuclease [Campylobacterales bacterium]
MPNKIHKQKPARTCAKTYSDYKSFKQYLVKDFNNRCGYCDSHDKFFGGFKNFQIDHFKPHSIAVFASLKHDYSNLVYSCQSCNRAKSNKWEDSHGFIDPCAEKYDEFISRDSNGRIKHNNTLHGEYIYSNLNLFLRRHELLWSIERLEEQREQINKLLDEKVYNDESVESKLLKKFRAVQNEITKYSNSLYIEIST